MLITNVLQAVLAWANGWMQDPTVVAVHQAVSAFMMQFGVLLMATLFLTCLTLRHVPRR